MLQKKAFRFRLYTTKEQAVLINKTTSINILTEGLYLLSGKKRTAGTAGVAWASLDQ